ncbi:hypothetical protein LAZ67_15001627 [Cordylochernes scorpioides]|uniref:Uncharacterized protein n=1 Tax=Cordylochernes scorpioides TaxID=51811 RepID=A0ABY6LBG4_9ARAC|nr:hypothetical protein LAZ67_15001627 [Cordylochernes scorpioides]
MDNKDYYHIILNVLMPSYKLLELIKADVEYNLEGNDKYELMQNKEDLLNLKASFDNQYVKLVKYKGINAEDKFKVSFEAKSKINSFLIKINRSLGNLNKNTFSGETHLELPKFQLPTFSGDSSDWLSFKEIFIRLLIKIQHWEIFKNFNI